jgi:hypothetical protein
LNKAATALVPAYCGAARANERPVPISESFLVRVIVLESEDSSGNQSKERQRDDDTVEEFVTTVLT